MALEWWYINGVQLFLENVFIFVALVCSVYLMSLPLRECMSWNVE